MNTRTVLYSLLGLSLLAFASADRATAQGGVKVTDLGSLGGTGGGVVNNNAHNQAVGDCAAVDGNDHYTFWSGGKVYDLGYDYSSNGNISINNLADITAVGSNNHTYLLKDGKTLDIGALGGGVSIPLCLSDKDQITGYSVNSNGSVQGFYWDPSFSSLVGLPLGSYVQSLANKINSLGQIAGVALDAHGNNYPVLWQSSASQPVTPTGLPTSYHAYFNNVNDSGVAVGEWDDPKTGKADVILWDQTHGVIHLGGPAGYDMGQSHYGNLFINDSGLVTGELFPIDGSGHQFPVVNFAWTQSSRFQDLSASLSFIGVPGFNTGGQIPGSDTHGQPVLYSGATITKLPALPSGWVAAQYGSLDITGDVSGDGLTPEGQHGLLYRHGHGLMDVFSAPGFPADANGVAFSPKPDGSVVGWYTTVDPYLLTQAFWWDPIHGLTVLPTLGGTNAYALGQNSSGLVVGGASRVNGSEGAYVYDQATGVIDDILFARDNGDSQAQAINDAGQVVGTYQAVFGKMHAFLYDPNASKDLTDLGDPGGTGYTNAVGISAAGKIVGFSRYANNVYHTFTWTALGGLTDPGSLGGGWTQAMAVNSWGQAAGGSNTASGAPHAFLLSASGAMLDLNSLLPASDGWTLTFGEGINDNGQISGQGTYHGDLHSFVVTPNVKLTGLTLSAKSVKGGGTVTGAVKLSAAAPYDLYVILSSTNPAVSVPAAVMVAGRATTATFTVTTTTVTKATMVKIVATFAGQSDAAPLKITP